MAEFIRADLRGSRFERVDLSGAEFRSVDLTNARFQGVDMVGVVIRGVDLVDVDIYGEIQNVTINGVDIAPLVTAELNRRYPDRAKMHPIDPAGFRAAWDVVERLWDETVERARRLDPELLHESVGGEWSFIETLRHLVFATDAWVRRAILGDPSPWDPLDLPWDEMEDTPGVPRDRDVRPSLDTVLALRRDRMSTVRQVVDSLTDESLRGDTEPVEGPGWPEPRSYPVRHCLWVVLNEEWEHRLYAERDLAALERASRSKGGPVGATVGGLDLGSALGCGVRFGEEQPATGGGLDLRFALGCNVRFWGKAAGDGGTSPPQVRSRVRLAHRCTASDQRMRWRRLFAPICECSASSGVAGRPDLGV